MALLYTRGSSLVRTGRPRRDSASPKTNAPRRNTTIRQPARRRASSLFQKRLVMVTITPSVGEHFAVGPAPVSWTGYSSPAKGRRVHRLASFCGTTGQRYRAGHRSPPPAAHPAYELGEPRGPSIAWRGRDGCDTCRPRRGARRRKYWEPTPSAHSGGELGGRP